MLLKLWVISTHPKGPAQEAPSNRKIVQTNTEVFALQAQFWNKMYVKFLQN